MVFNGAPTTNPQNQKWNGREQACRVEIQRKWMEWGVANLKYIYIHIQTILI